MLLQIPSRSGRRRHGQCGWTLVELVVAAAVGLIILGAFVTITLNINTTMAAIGNYDDLDKASRVTLDNLSRDVRNSAVVSPASTASMLMLTNTYFGTNSTVTYSWDGSNNVTRTLNGGTPQVMLKSCDYLAFSYFIRVPTNNLQFISITNVFSTNQIKLISVSWRCSRSVLGSKLNTESVQTANIVMRN